MKARHEFAVKSHSRGGLTGIDWDIANIQENEHVPICHH